MTPSGRGVIALLGRFGRRRGFAFGVDREQVGLGGKRKMLQPRRDDGGEAGCGDGCSGRAGRAPRGARGPHNPCAARSRSRGNPAPSAHIRRSRVTLAMIEAAAIEATMPSPPITASQSQDVASLSRPSTKTCCGISGSACTARASAQSEARRMLSRSIRAGDATATEYAAVAQISSNNSSRRSAVSRFGIVESPWGSRLGPAPRRRPPRGRPADRARPRRSRRSARPRA